MRRTLIPMLFLMLFLIITPSAFAQAPRSTHAQANRAWPVFWKQFGAAIRRKDRAAFKRLMASEREFFSGGGGETRDQWITMIGWKQLQAALTIGTMPFNEGRRPGRITRDRGLIFEFVRGRWLFTGVMGD